MRRFGTSKSVFGILLLIALPIGAQECSSLNSSTPDRLASYLAVFPDKVQNAPCVAFAIRRLGQQQYEPATPILTKYLDFRWPVGAHQKQSRAVLERDHVTVYPAADALEKIGQGSLPALLTAIQAKGTSRVGMEVAVSVWMTIHKNDAAAGVAVLKQEAGNATDPFSKGQLRWATRLAVTNWCAPSEQAQCSAASQ